MQTYTHTDTHTLDELLQVRALRMVMALVFLLLLLCATLKDLSDTL